MKEYIIKEFEDLLNLLRERSDYLEKLRVLILTKELLELPIKFEEFRNEVNRRFDELDKRFEEVDKRFEEVDRRLEALEKGQEEIKEKLKEHDKEIEEIKQKLDRHEKSIQELKGWQLEHKVRMNICAYVGKYIKKCRIKDKSEMADELDEYVEKNIINEIERDDVLLLDILVSGISKKTKEEIFIAIEISYKIGNNDIERVIKRKEILERVYKKEIIPFIIGKEISDKTKNKLKKLGIDFILVSD